MAFYIALDSPVVLATTLLCLLVHSAAFGGSARTRFANSELSLLSILRRRLIFVNADCHVCPSCPNTPTPPWKLEGTGLAGNKCMNPA